MSIVGVERRKPISKDERRAARPYLLGGGTVEDTVAEAAEIANTERNGSVKNYAQNCGSVKN